MSGTSTGIRGLHHPAFATSDMDRTVRFWRDLLGLSLGVTLKEDGERQYFFALNDTVFVVFFEWPEVEPVPYHHPGMPVKGPKIFDHLCLEMEDEESQWALVAQLEDNGFPVTDAVDHGLVRSVYTFDPNGIPLEFTLRNPATDPAHTPVLADPAPGPAAAEGSAPGDGGWAAGEPIAEDDRIVTAGSGHGAFPPFPGKAEPL